MKLFLRHSFYRTLTLSRGLSILGSYLYNLVFVIYAASLPYQKTALFMANAITVIPSLLGFWIGIKADQTVRKRQLLISLGFIQAALFTAVAVLIADQTFLVFSIICLINIVSDLMGDYGSGLRMPMLQYNLEADELYEAYAFNQVVTYLAMIVGQGFGVWLLTVSHQNFALVALLNALTFLLSSLLLFKHRGQLTHAPVQVLPAKESLWQKVIAVYQEMTTIFKTVSDVSFAALFFSVLLTNAMGGAIGALYNFYLLDKVVLGFSYGQLLLLVQVIFVVASIIGSMTPNDYFGQKPLNKLIAYNALAFFGVGLANVLQLNLFIGMLCLAFAAYITGKAMPKLDALLLANLPAEKLAQSNGLLSLLFAFSAPLGIMIFSSLALYNLSLCWLVFICLSLIVLMTTSCRVKK